MPAFYREPQALQEHFILRHLNPAIESIIKNDILGSFESGKVLDIGCGKQPLKKHFIEKGFIYKGLDYRQNEPGNIDYIAKIDDPFLNIDERFDIIVCTEVMEHVLDWKVAFQNIAKLCSQTGLVLITCPMFYPLHEEPFDFWRPTPYAISAYAKMNGFRIVKESKIGDGKDVIGTILSNCYFYPGNNKVTTRFATKLINKARKYILNNIAQQNDTVYMKSPFFMSNLFLLKRNS